LLLKPDRFTARPTFYEFGELVRRAAENLDIEFSTEGVKKLRPRIRKTEAGIYAPDEVAGAWERVAKNPYVAHVDMLGMSRLTLLNPKLAWSVVSDMVIALRRVLAISYVVNGREIKIADHVASFTFSDTVLLFTRGDEAEDLRSILFACLELFAQLLSRSAPFRIGVAHGLFVFNQDENAFVGPPLIQAYRLGEEARWLGAVLDEPVAKPSTSAAANP
jgi:hypothetical protein